MNPDTVSSTPSETAPRFLDKRGVARLLACSPRTVDSLMVQGRLPYVRLNRKFVRFNEQDVLRFIKERFSFPGGAW